MDLDLGIISEGEKRLKKKLILDYVYANLKHHNWWAYRYFFCELLALINVIGEAKTRYNADLENCKTIKRPLTKYRRIIYMYA